MITAPKASLLDYNKGFKNCPGRLRKKTVLKFWRWAFSDLLQNTTRGVLAEYIVAVLLGADRGPRDPWQPFDLKLPDERTVEIKTMSKLQAWAQKQLSKPTVDLSPRRYWDASTNVTNKNPSLNADLYIICYFTAEQHSTADALDLDQWQFFLLDKKAVEDILKKTKTVTLKTLAKRGINPLKAHELKSKIDDSLSVIAET